MCRYNQIPITHDGKRAMYSRVVAVRFSVRRMIARASLEDDWVLLQMKKWRPKHKLFAIELWLSSKLRSPPSSQRLTHNNRSLKLINELTQTDSFFFYH